MGSAVIHASSFLHFWLAILLFPPFSQLIVYSPPFQLLGRAMQQRCWRSPCVGRQCCSSCSASVSAMLQLLQCFSSCNACLLLCGRLKPNDFSCVYLTADCLLPSLSVIGQSYAAEVMTSYHVMGGNTALLACQLPSFVTDLVRVVGWADDQGNEYLGSTSNYGNC
jgi:hypothetical protein